ncbi:hypothetical protein Dsin_032156 [Dipteronia sinensis]|uniref:Reverse transcriptase domain-containing protein n=1 Tax=Dipteronia sinensis TaxID=43782 RepID=A0AAD9ZMX0_9ROSI|nr:hypothetical protein Dsin_032156 [Dipteronia sinensis]
MGVVLAMKIDICKAFDNLRWDFLKHVLAAFGFNDTFIAWMDAILGSSCLSILLNSSPEGYFKCSRGVRQGDPFSPHLFGIVEDFLSCYLFMLSCKGKLLPISTSSGFQAPTQLL